MIQTGLKIVIAGALLMSLSSLAPAQESFVGALTSLKPRVDENSALAYIHQLPILPGDISRLTQGEVSVIEEALRQNSHISGNQFYILFGDPVRLRRISTFPLRNSTYSFNIPPKSKIICARMSGGAVADFSSVENSANDWLKVSGVASQNGFIFKATTEPVSTGAF